MRTHRVGLGNRGPRLIRRVRTVMLHADRLGGPEERVQPLGDPLPSSAKKPLIGIHGQQIGRRRDALRHKRALTGLLDHWREVYARWLVAESAVRLAADERQVRDVVGLTRRMDRLEDGFREDVVELQFVLRAGMIERDRQVRPPILRPRGPEREEHRLKERAALIAALQFLGCHVEPAHLEAQPVDQRLRAGAVPDRGQVLVEDRLARAP